MPHWTNTTNGGTEPNLRGSVSRTGRSRRLALWTRPGIVALIGIALSAGACAELRSRQRALRRIEFERGAHRIAVAARSSFDIPLEVLRSVPALFEASKDVTRSEFRVFVSSALARYPWIYAIEWIPRVPANQRAAMEAAAVADGIAGFHFKQDAPRGPPVRADDRNEYFPLYYMEPPNAVALGIEETALDARRIALERARDLDTTAITERLQLVQDADSIASVIAFHPVYRDGHHQNEEARRQHLMGMAAAVFRIHAVVGDVLHGGDVARYDLALIDLDANPPALLYASTPAASQIGVVRKEAQFEQLMTIGGRRWAIRIGDRANWVNANDAGWLEAGIGVLISLALAALVFARRSVQQLRKQIRAARKLGQYTLVEKLGEGGMGTVYRAHHAMLRRPTAIKLLHATHNPTAALARFESEVQLTSTLTHPNTVVIYDYGRSPDQVFYYAMEYIQGATLQDIVDACGPQSPERVVPILLQICAALAEAHGIGLVHRDIKPANVMLCTRGNIPDFVKVLDFGLVKDLSEGSSESELSRAAALIGTPLYVAPEVALRRPIDARADLYALGALAYFLLTGTPVFTGTTVLEVCVKHFSVPPDAMSERLGRAMHVGLESVITQCLAKEPANRPESAEAVIAALQGLDIEVWRPDAARHWWREHRDIVEAHVRDARSAQDKSTELTLDVDRSYRNDPTGGDHIVGGGERQSMD